MKDSPQTLAALSDMGLARARLELMREKDGVALYRVHHAQQSLVLKVFEQEAYAREIACYELLASLGVQTIKVLAKTDRALLMEDLLASDAFRLGRETDCGDPAVMGSLGAWYKQLHEKGRPYLAGQPDPRRFYSELDEFTPDNIKQASLWTGTVDKPLWGRLAASYEAIETWLHQAELTLCYNDFHWDNLAVSKDSSSAFMFDYNFLGRGLAAGDLGNALCFSDERGKSAFLSAYQLKISPQERAMDLLLSPVTSLFIAMRQNRKPPWAQEIISRIGLGELNSLLSKALEAIS